MRAMAAELVRDEDLVVDEGTLREHYEMHNSALGQMTEARRTGAPFLPRWLRLLPAGLGMSARRSMPTTLSPVTLASTT